jgi:hypothetical protein
MGADREAIEGDLGDTELLERQFNLVREGCDNIAKGGLFLVLEDRHMERGRECPEETATTLRFWKLERTNLLQKCSL